MLAAIPVVARATAEAELRVLAAQLAPAAAPQAVAAVAAILADDVDGHAAALSRQFAARLVHATVLAVHDGESGIVEIGGRPFAVRSNLPPAGSEVILRFPPAAAAAGAPGVAAFAAASPGRGTAEDRPQVSLGDLASALAKAGSAEGPPRSLGAVPAPPTSPPAFAAALAAMVRDSGMFYEAHLARYSRGRYPLELIAREPQARKAAPYPGAPASHAMDKADTQAAAAAQSSEAARSSSEAARPLLHDQLELLEHRSFTVAIEPWPGQVASLAICDEGGAPGAPDGEPGARTWASRLVLDLPRLGRIEARITLCDTLLRLDIGAASSAAQLNGAAASLDASLRQAGLALTSLAIDDAPGH